MRRIFTLVATALLMLVTSCGDHFINDSDYRKQVEKDFDTKVRTLDCPEAFSIFETPLSTDEREALMFLYAYMPIGDILNHDGEYFSRTTGSQKKHSPPCHGEAPSLKGKSGISSFR